MAKFALVGSSFVERLRRFTSDDFKVPGEVKWFGVPGLRSYSLSKEMWSNIVTFNPDCVFRGRERYNNNNETERCCRKNHCDL